MKFQQQPESTWNPAKVTKPVTQNLPKPEKIEIFRDHMIEQFYLVQLKKKMTQRFAENYFAAA